MNNGPSGFHNAPVTKGLLITCAIVSIIIGMRGGSSACSLSYQAIMRKLHLWRLVSSALVFSSTPELMLGTYLMYYFRVFERQIGSNKYSVFILFSMLFATLFELIALAIFKDPDSSGLAPGPYGLIFASFIPFFFDIPISTRFRIFSVRFSDKSFVYLAGVQLLLSSWKKSFIPGLCGVFAGISYRLNVFGIRRVKFLELVVSPISRFSLASVSAGSSVDVSRANIAREPIDSSSRQFEGDFMATAPLLTPIEDPSEEAISTLVSMGFDRNIAIQSLIQGGNDIHAATNILLGAQTH